MTAWAVLRGLLNLLPLAPLTDRFASRAVGGALCGVGLATFYLLLSLQDFTAVTPEKTLAKALPVLDERGATGGHSVLPAARAVRCSGDLAALEVPDRNTLRAYVRITTSSAGRSE